MDLVLARVNGIRQFFPLVLQKLQKYNENIVRRRVTCHISMIKQQMTLALHEKMTLTKCKF